MSQRATCWSVTINMKSVSKTTADECIQLARAAGWKVEGQLEKGEEGTEHYQLMVSTPQVRFTAIKKVFPTAHIEVARKPQALKAYVHKEETREGSLPKQSEFYPSLAKFWDLLIPVLRPLSEYGAESINPKRRLDQLDDAVRILITKGYHVEGIGMNPATRSAWNTYNVAITARHENEKMRREELDRQTDRQVEFSSEDITIPTTEDGEDQGDDSEGGSWEEEGEDSEVEYGPDDSPDCEDDEVDESSEEGETDSEGD